jgi:hypothetical protein
VYVGTAAGESVVLKGHRWLSGVALRSNHEERVEVLGDAAMLQCAPHGGSTSTVCMLPRLHIISILLSLPREINYCEHTIF